MALLKAKYGKNIRSRAASLIEPNPVESLVNQFSKKINRLETIVDNITKHIGQ